MSATIAGRISPARLVRLFVAIALALGVLAVIAPAQPADAATTIGQRAVTIAAQQHGKPYRYGAAGPKAFDCSGLTLYVYKRLGKKLPHNTEAQRRAFRAVSKKHMRAGDLVLFTSSSGRAYHVGIYAGGGKIWHAPQPGARVKLARIWDSHYVVRRVAW
ncbi:MAG: hypothetical protein QOE58_206 [Actinomycetota bacterium]|jgi:cell wall-associated NlpC family hydrolase|nr:hypothetical protein [Actinomycetota bacterium]